MRFVMSGENNSIEIVLVSDNHGLEDVIDELHNKYPITDYFIHCGDSEMPKYRLEGFAAVMGNNDYYGEYPMHLILEIGSHRIYVCHGHRDMIYGHFEMLAAHAKEHGCDIACFGHTHIPFDQVIDGVHLLNPGSIWRNRDGSEPSYMIIHLNGDKVFADLIRYSHKK